MSNPAPSLNTPADRADAPLGGRFTPPVVAAVVVAGLIALAAAVGAVAGGNKEFVFYLVLMILVIIAILLLHRRLGLSTPLIWLLVAWAGLHMAGGLVPVPQSWPIDGAKRVLYSWWIIVPVEGGSAGWLKFDQVVHAYGYGVTTWLWWELLSRIMRQRHRVSLRPTFGSLSLCATAACGVGALNEVVEFVATRFAETNVGGYENTGWDLVYNAAGAIIAASLIRVIATVRTRTESAIVG